MGRDGRRDPRAAATCGLLSRADSINAFSCRVALAVSDCRDAFAMPLYSAGRMATAIIASRKNAMITSTRPKPRLVGATIAHRAPPPVRNPRS